jgi:hypothetical protein
MLGTKLKRETVKDRDGRTIGYIETCSDGRTKATDRDSRTLGYFDPRRNVTTDRDNRILARANVLSGLVYDHR